jgi:hypothetical protein
VVGVDNWINTSPIHPQPPTRSMKPDAVRVSWLLTHIIVSLIRKLCTYTRI